jgi:putative oxidoreductase
MTRHPRLDFGLLVLRIGFVLLLIAFHGGARFVRAVDYAVLGEPWTFVALVEQLRLPFAPAFAVLSALAESMGAVLVGIGLLTRPAALVIAMNFAVACVNETINGDPVELPALYLVCTLVIAICGPGSYSIDRLWRRRQPDAATAAAASAIVTNDPSATRVA